MKLLIRSRACCKPAARTRAFDYLIEHFRKEKNQPTALPKARLMKARHELGLPLIPTEPLRDLPEETRNAYDEKSIEAAREAGDLFLAEGHIDRAWPYFRAVGDPKPVVNAIDRLEPPRGSRRRDRGRLPRTRPYSQGL